MKKFRSMTNEGAKFASAIQMRIVLAGLAPEEPCSLFWGGRGVLGRPVKEGWTPSLRAAVAVELAELARTNTRTVVRLLYKRCEK